MHRTMNRCKLDSPVLHGHGGVAKFIFNSDTRLLAKAEKGLYGNTPMMRYVAGSDEPIYPIGFVQPKPPRTKK